MSPNDRVVLSAEDLASIRRALEPGSISPYTEAEANLARAFLATLDEVIGILTRYEHSVMVDSTELRRSVAARLGLDDQRMTHQHAGWHQHDRQSEGAEHHHD